MDTPHLWKPPYLSYIKNIYHPHPIAALPIAARRCRHRSLASGDELRQVATLQHPGHHLARERDARGRADRFV